MTTPSRRPLVVRPTLGNAREYPICPEHKWAMKPRAARVIEDGLTYLWWECPRGGCITAMVPIPPKLIDQLGPAGAVIHDLPV